MHECGAWPKGAIAKAAVLWDPAPALPSNSRSGNAPEAEGSREPHMVPEAASGDIGKKRKRRRRAKGEEKEAGPGGGDAPVITIDPEAERTVWIRTHPAAFDAVFSSLRESASVVLADAAHGAFSSQGKGKQRASDKDESGQKHDPSIELADLRGQICVFELTGPKATQVLRGALTAVPDNREEFKKFWSGLADVQTSGSVPRGMVVGCTLHDPRLK